MKVVKELIRWGSAVNARDMQGMTPLLVCCSSGRVDLIDVLLREGADILVRDNSNRSGRDIADFYHRSNAASKVKSLMLHLRK